MDFSIVIVAFVAFIGGMLLISRVTAWLAGLALAFKSTDAGRGGPTVPLLAQFFLHSGPWSLLVVVGALYYAASLAEPSWFWAALVGVGLAVALLTVVISVAYWRQQTGIAAPVPLTPERLLKIKRRFLWGTSLFYGGGMAVVILYQMWPYFGQSVGLAVMVVGICLAGGYVFSWFMWQFHGAALQAREDARRRAEQNKVI